MCVPSIKMVSELQKGVGVWRAVTRLQCTTGKTRVSLTDSLQCVIIGQVKMSSDGGDFSQPQDNYSIEEQPPAVASQESKQETPIIIAGKPYQSILFKDVYFLIQRHIRLLSNLFECSQDWALVFYQHCQWDFQRCKSTFFLNQQYLYKKCGFNNNVQKFVEAEQQCQVCEMIHNVLLQLNCGHRICQPCAQSYTTFNVNREDIYFVCSHQQCNTPYLKSTIEPFIKGNIKLEQAYIRGTIKKFIQANSAQFIQCLATDCPFVIYRADSSLKDVKCECGLKFCWNCRQICHAPSTCSQVQQWTTSIVDDPTSLYLRRRTRVCPSCSVLICRSGGCNEVTCRCKTKFCFICGGIWSKQHVYPYMCPNYNQQKSNLVRDRKVFEIINRFYGIYTENEIAYRRLQEAEKAIEQRRQTLFNLLNIDYMSSIFLQQVYFQAKELHLLMKWSYPLSHFCNKEDNKADIYLNQQRNAQDKLNKVANSLVNWFSQFLISLVPVREFDEKMDQYIQKPVDYAERSAVFRTWRQDIRKEIKAAQLFMQTVVNIAQHDLKFDSSEHWSQAGLKPTPIKAVEEWLVVIKMEYWQYAWWFIVFFYFYAQLIYKMDEASQYQPWYEMEGVDPEVRRREEERAERERMRFSQRYLRGEQVIRWKPKPKKSISELYFEDRQNRRRQYEMRLEEQRMEREMARRPRISEPKPKCLSISQMAGLFPIDY